MYLSNFPPKELAKLFRARVVVWTPFYSSQLAKLPHRDPEDRLTVTTAGASKIFGGIDVAITPRSINLI